MQIFVTVEYLLVIDVTNRSVDEGGDPICGDAVAFVDVTENVIFWLHSLLHCFQQIDASETILVTFSERNWIV